MVEKKSLPFGIGTFVLVASGPPKGDGKADGIAVLFFILIWIGNKKARV